MFNLCSVRKANLLESLRYFQFLQDSEEEEAWLVETGRILKSADTGKDLRAVISLMRKHEVSLCVCIVWPTIGSCDQSLCA